VHAVRGRTVSEEIGDAEGGFGRGMATWLARWRLVGIQLRRRQGAASRGGGRREKSRAVS